MLFMHYSLIFPFKDKHGMKKPKTSVPKNVSDSLYVWLKSSGSSCIKWFYKYTAPFNANHKEKFKKNLRQC